MYCSKCGTENPDDGDFCNNCGNALNKLKTKMDKTSEKNVNQGNKITLSIVISWLFGLLFLIIGLAFFSEKDFISATPIILASLLLIPPVTKLLKDKLNFELSRVERIIFVIILLIAFVMLVPDTNSDINTIPNTNSQTLESSIPIQTSNPTSAPTPIQTPTPTKTPTPSPTPVPVPTIEKIKCTFEEFDSIFGERSSLTELQKEDQFENNYEGKIITWDGYVERVYEGWTGDYCVWMRSSSTVEGNADFKSCFEGENNKDTLLSLQDGDHVRIIGTIENYQDLYPSYYVEGMQLKNI